MNGSLRSSRTLPPDLTLLRVRAELARRSLREFICQAWHVVEPSTPFAPGWHIDAISEHLEAVSRGEIRNLLVNVPPRHMKSLAVSVFFPCWLWASRPALRFLFASYAASLSVRDSLKCRRLIESPWFQAAFGQVFRLAGDQNLKTRFDNDHQGYRIATSVGGSITGEGGDVLVVDDPHNVVEAESEVVRSGVLDWYDTVMSTRANDPKKSVRIIIMQRVHESDLSGHVLAQGGWTHLRLPAEYDGRRCVTSIGWEDPRQKEGELLWPERFGEKEIGDLKAQLGTYGAAGQLQQLPAPAGGGMFKREWFRYFQRGIDHILLNQHQLPHSSLYRFCTADLATSVKTSADYTVISTWGVYTGKPAELVLLDIDRRRMEGPDIVPALHQAVRAWNPAFVGIETNGFQLAIAQQAKREGIPAREMKVDRDKVSRAIAATPLMEQGHIWFPASAAWLGEIEHELLTFPAGDHDDFVDTLSAAVLEMNFASAPSWIERTGLATVRPEEDPDEEQPHPLDGFLPLGPLRPPRRGSRILPPAWM